MMLDAILLDYKVENGDPLVSKLFHYLESMVAKRDMAAQFCILYQKADLAVS